eukprot:CAMPEP_0172924684 /NCGR_PEP_ID=MMETSP1075-20121228/212146_1 /TAXON_ID=2916 /ORGANISM="Ceratium fusus, Strain PA161109" /LENGTH=115 /DNA_ID=CAMNT_0013785387 /DNA_START=455 /DNA_END=799 /DNA_ORIENTATION=+
MSCSMRLCWFTQHSPTSAKTATWGLPLDCLMLGMILAWTCTVSAGPGLQPRTATHRVTLRHRHVRGRMLDLSAASVSPFRKCGWQVVCPRTWARVLDEGMLGLSAIILLQELVQI